MTAGVTPVSRPPVRERPAVSQWHPLLAAVEPEPGVWVMVAQYGEQYGVIRMVRRGSEVGYRADLGAEGERGLVGYFRTLRAACVAVHRRWIAAHGPDPWGQQRKRPQQPDTWSGAGGAVPR